MNKMIGVIKNKYKEVRVFLSGTLTVIDWAFMLAGLIFCFMTMYYADITVTGQYGLTFWDSLFDGRPLSFYYNALNNGVAPEGAVYDIGIYIIFGIWQLPVWILNKLFGVSALSVGALLWLKLLPVLFTLTSAYEVKEAGRRIGIASDRLPYLVIIYLLTSTVVMPTFVVAQYDVISLYFMLKAINGYLEGDDRKFYLSFAIGLTIKPIIIIALVVLVVIKDKNVVRIVIDMAKGCLLLIACKGIYSLDPSYRISCTGFLSGGLESVFSESLVLEGSSEIGSFPLLILGLVIIYILAYVKDTLVGTVAGNREVVWFVFSVWAAFVTLGSVTPYWTIYFAPFAVLVAFTVSVNTSRVLLIEAVMNAALTIVKIMRYAWVYGGSMTYKYLVLKPLCEGITDNNDGVTVAGIFTRLHLSEKLPYVNSILLGAMIMLLYYGWKNTNSAVSHTESEAADSKGLIWNVRLRILMLWGWIGVSVCALILYVIGY